MKREECEIVCSVGCKNAKRLIEVDAALGFTERY